MDEKFEEQFKNLTEGIEVEQVYDKLTLRGDLARLVALHSAEVYKAARQGGLSRAMATYMAKSYWDYEMQPTEVYMVGEG